MVILFLVLAESKIGCGWEGLAIIPLFIIQLAIKTISIDMVKSHEIQCVTYILGMSATYCGCDCFSTCRDPQNNALILGPVYKLALLIVYTMLCSCSDR